MTGDEEKDTLYKSMAGIVTLAVMLSTGVNTGIQKFYADARSDPFTGDDGDKILVYVDKHMQALEGVTREHVRITGDRLDRIDGIQQVMINRMGECEAQRLRTRTDIREMWQILYGAFEIGS
jgi:hypothetical protein